MHVNGLFRSRSGGPLQRVIRCRSGQITGGIRTVCKKLSVARFRSVECRVLRSAFLVPEVVGLFRRFTRLYTGIFCSFLIFFREGIVRLVQILFVIGRRAFSRLVIFTIGMRHRHMTHQFGTTQQERMKASRAFHVLLAIRILSMRDTNKACGVHLFVRRGQYVITSLRLNQGKINGANGARRNERSIQQKGRRIIRTKLGLVKGARRREGIRKLKMQKVLQIFHVLTTRNLSVIKNGRSGNVLIRSRFLRNVRCLARDAISAHREDGMMTYALYLRRLKINVQASRRTIRELIFVRVRVFLRAIIREAMQAVKEVRTCRGRREFLQITCVPLILRVERRLTQFIWQ